MASTQQPSVTAPMYSTGKYSDMTITCKGKTFKVHRCVVCLQSKPLAAAIDGKFKEGTTREIDLDDDEPEIVEKMLTYLYTSDYSDGRTATENTAITLPSTPASTSSPAKTSKPGLFTNSALLTNAQVFIIADKYDIQGLKMLAKVKYEEVIPQNWNSASFVASLKLLYEETLESDRLLKDVAIKTAGEHVNELMDRGEFAVLYKENGELAFDVLKASLVDPPGLRCPSCGLSKVQGYVHVNTPQGYGTYRWRCSMGHYFN